MDPAADKEVYCVLTTGTHVAKRAKQMERLKVACTAVNPGSWRS